MITGSQVLEMLIPSGGWVITGNDFEGIQFFECEPITKKEFEDGFKKYESWVAVEATAKAEAKAALLDRLGISEEEAKLLLG
jgi:hypothetical protein